MTDDFALRVGFGWCSEIRLLSVGEGTGLEVLDCELDVESLVGRDGVEIGRVLELQSGKGIRDLQRSETGKELYLAARHLRLRYND